MIDSTLWQVTPKTEHNLDNWWKCYDKSNILSKSQPFLFENILLYCKNFKNSCLFWHCLFENFRNWPRKMKWNSFIIIILCWLNLFAKSLKKFLGKMDKVTKMVWLDNQNKDWIFCVPESFSRKNNNARSRLPCIKYL